LGHEENFVQGVICDVGTAEELLSSGIRQDYERGQVTIEIDELNLGVVFSRRAGDVVL